MDYDRKTLMSQIHEVLVTVAFPSPRREQGEGFVLSILSFFFSYEDDRGFTSNVYSSSKDQSKDLDITQGGIGFLCIDGLDS